MIPKISVAEALKTNHIFIDTRTPKEFAEDHLPHAINVPILSNEERAVVGTLYTQVSREDAVNKGVELFAQKLPTFMKQINQYRQAIQTLTGPQHISKGNLDIVVTDNKIEYVDPFLQKTQQKQIDVLEDNDDFLFKMF